MKKLQQYKEETTQQLFRLEYRRVYNVPADLEEFEKWKRGEPTAAADPDNDYWKEVRALRERDVEVIRVRVVDFPISSYILYEIDFYRGSLEQGEDIRFVERAPTIDCMQSTVVTQDFWLFDARTVLLWKYDSDGRRDGQEEIADPGQVSRFVRLRECLLERALPMEDFIHRYPDSFAAAQGQR